MEGPLGGVGLPRRPSLGWGASANEGRAQGFQRAAGGQDAHDHQTSPGGKVHVHLRRAEEVLPCRWGGGRGEGKVSYNNQGVSSVVVA